MISVFISIGTFLLILVAIALILVVLAQRASSDSGMAVMGGGMMESTFGPDTTNVLSKFTIRATIAFFVLSFLLYLGYVRIRSHGAGGRSALPSIATGSVLPAPATVPSAAPSVAVPMAAPEAPKTSAPAGPAAKTP
jgi:preprotein translocase subunit SecG